MVERELYILLTTTYKATLLELNHVKTVILYKMLFIQVESRIGSIKI